MLSLISSAALAGPGAYGETFVRVGESWPDAGRIPLAGTATPGATRERVDFVRHVNALEQAGGPYADTLAEPLADLGRHHRENGDLLQAQRLYRRALHVVRINDGLYSERQLPILQELFDAYRSAGDMEALDARYDYYFRLYGSGQPPFTPVRLQAAIEYLRWQREALRVGMDREANSRLLQLYHLNKQILASAAEDPSVDVDWYRQLVFSQILNLYLLEDRAAPTVENAGLAPPVPLLAGEWNDRDFDKKRLENIRRGGLSSGRKLLQELLARTPPQQPAELARVYLELGDWNQWNGREGEARAQYAEVERLLQVAKRQDLLQQWLAQATELPDNGAFWQPQILPEGSRAVVVQASYGVSARGRARDIEVTVADPDNESLAWRFKRQLAKIRFRPRFANGQPEVDARLSREYELID